MKLLLISVIWCVWKRFFLACKESEEYDLIAVRSSAHSSQLDTKRRNEQTLFIHGLYNIVLFLYSLSLEKERRWLYAHHHDFINSYIKLLAHKKKHFTHRSKSSECWIYEVHCRFSGVYRHCTVHIVQCSMHFIGIMWPHVQTGLDDNSSQPGSLTVWKWINAQTCLLNYSMNELCYRIYWIGASSFARNVLSVSSKRWARNNDEPPHIIRHTLFRFEWIDILENGLEYTTLHFISPFNRNHNDVDKMWTKPQKKNKLAFGLWKYGSKMTELGIICEVKELKKC